MVSLAQFMLAAWYLLMAILGLLAALSAGRRTGPGRLALLTALAAAILLATTLLGVPDLPLLASHWTTVSIALVLYCLVSGLALMALAPRQDSKLIALLLAGASLLPLAAFFWAPGSL